MNELQKMIIMIESSDEFVIKDEDVTITFMGMKKELLLKFLKSMDIQLKAKHFPVKEEDVGSLPIMSAMPVYARG